MDDRVDKDKLSHKYSENAKDDLEKEQRRQAENLKSAEARLKIENIRHEQEQERQRRYQEEIRNTEPQRRQELTSYYTKQQKLMNIPNYAKDREGHMRPLTPADYEKISKEVSGEIRNQNAGMTTNINKEVKAATAKQIDEVLKHEKTHEESHRRADIAQWMKPEQKQLTHQKKITHQQDKSSESGPKSEETKRRESLDRWMETSREIARVRDSGIEM